MLLRITLLLIKLICTYRYIFAIVIGFWKIATYFLSTKIWLLKIYSNCSNPKHENGTSKKVGCILNMNSHLLIVLLVDCHIDEIDLPTLRR